MAEPYQLPTARVLAVDRSCDVSTVAIEISREDYVSYPIAPASLWRLDSDEEVFSFHQLVRREYGRLVFETYGTDAPPPRVGSTHRFCSWWIPAAMDAVRETSARWERLTYPDDGCHDHCLLTWERLSAQGPHTEGYRSPHGWITVEACHEFIEQDRFRLRSHWRSIE